MSLHTPVSKAVRWALLGAVAATVAAPQAFAADEPKGEVERIEVTGSRIKRTDVENASPITVVDRQAIEKSGVTSTGELLQRLPSIAGSATNPAVNNGGGAGAARISMRGIGSERTLVLVNGRRFVDNDVNAVPMNIIERVEVLKDGASAIYGSDAIGGVVNFITRKDFDGVVASAYYGQSSENDGQQSTVDVTAGASSEKGNFVVGMSYTDNDEIGAGAREYSNLDRTLYDGTVEDSGSPTPPWVRYQIPAAAALPLGFTPENCPGAPAGNVYLTRRGLGDGSNTADYRCFALSGAENDLYNYQPDNLAITPIERKSVFFQGNYALSDDIEYFNNATYNNTLSNSRLAPNPQGALTIHATNPYNPFGVTLRSNAVRVNNFGPRIQQYETTNLEMTNGLRGTFGDSWSWDAAYTWADQKQYANERGYLFKVALDNALGAAFDSNADGINDKCGTSAATEIVGCTPINISWLGDVTANDPALDQIKNMASPILQAYDNFKQQIIEANLTGDLFELPAGPVGFATGVQHRWLSYVHNPDFLSLGDPCKVTAEACDNKLGGDYDVDELYVEFNLPLLSDAPLAKSLELSIGSRYSDYSTFGETTNSKVGVLYQPIDDVKLRATWAEVFRAPTIGDLYTGNTPSADTFTDPCNGITTAGNPACVGVPTDGTFRNNFQQLSAITGGNLQLQPETGETFTIGAVYAPSWLDNFSATVDYYKIELEGTISTVGTQNILDLCFTSGQYCERIQRGEGGILGPDDQGRVYNQVSNVGMLETQGVDLNLRYLIPETGLGSFAVNFDTTYIIQYDKQAVTGIPDTTVKHAGMFYESAAGGEGNYPRWRAMTDLSWNYGDWEANYGIRYIHHTAEQYNSADACLAGTTAADVVADCPNSFGNFGQKRDIPAYVYHDLQGSYNFSDIGTRLTLGVENLTDKQPPRMYTGFNGDTDVRTYDTVGRFYYARATVKF